MSYAARDRMRQKEVIEIDRYKEKERVLDSQREVMRKEKKETERELGVRKEEKETERT
jgi:hypothetical protein